MRGDFVHAGAYAQECRAHIEMYPQSAAGWDEDNPYWDSEKMDHWQKNKITFLIPDLRCRPFGYPHMSKKTQAGDQTVTYPPPQLTSDLIAPKQRAARLKKRKRRVYESDVKVDDTGNSDDCHDPEYEAAVARQKNSRLSSANKGHKHANMWCG
jgi:hypothetical protein